MSNESAVRWVKVKHPKHHRDDQVYYEDGKAYRIIGNEWVRAPEQDALMAHTSSLNKPWRRPDGAIMIAE